MKVEGKVVVVTGGADGIGRALARRFHRENARTVAVVDLNAAGAAAVAAETGGASYECDVSDDSALRRVIEDVEERFGPIALFCSNAGIAAGFDLTSDNAAFAADEVWNRSWAVNVMAHVHAARILVPRMRARGGGYFLNTASAAGLLSQVGGAVYATTKHAAIGFAENLAISHRADGIKVSVLCPQGVDTPMLRSLPAGPQSSDGVLSPDDVADAAIRGLADERFLILPHPEVATYMRNKVTDYDRWIGGMAKLQRAFREPAA
ncbi:MAG: SDR family oxidoreductase [Acetobacteraceae bacterium]|nr:SDR family oxidoreductase [Acetobacteraceae bacterium]